MMYPFMTLNDDTEITHSEMKADGKVKVYIETPNFNDGFHNATCWLPDDALMERPGCGADQLSNTLRYNERLVKLCLMI